jgi:hypothetical protein
MTIIDKETFSQLVKHPHEMDADIIPNLEATIKAFPYCQISYSLLAKASSLIGPDQLKQAKPRAAAYALSRIALQQLVENNNERYDPTIVPVNHANTTAPEIDLPDTEDVILNIVSQDPVAVPTEKTEEQKRQQKIIEGFIKNNPRIATIKVDNNSEIAPVNLSGRVAQEGQGAVETEAFALILIRQGKIEKAIDIYQKLILRKPEKKNYFAKKLSELNRSVTNK